MNGPEWITELGRPRQRLVTGYDSGVGNGTSGNHRRITKDEIPGNWVNFQLGQLY